jgi:hypothetical protein
MAENVKIERKGDVLHIEIACDAANRAAAAASKTGRSRVLASTGGFIPVTGKEGIKLSVLAILPLGE